VGQRRKVCSLAAAAGTPTLGLFGLTDAAEYAPSGPRLRAVVSARMGDLSVEQTLSEAVRWLAKDPAILSRVAAASTVVG
jgi:hypothetical protein